MAIDDSVLERAKKIPGIRAAVVLAAPGKIASGTVEPKELEGFFELLFQAAGDVAKSGVLGEVNRVNIRTDKYEDLSLFFENEKALAVVSERSRPLSDVCKEIEATIRS